MTKPELGTKRLCANCSARYYDLNKTPITCPKCGAPFEVVATTTRSRFRQQAVVSQPEVEPEEARSETELEVETEDVETDETAKDDSEDTLIEEVEEEGTDVSEIIGEDVKDEEDT